MSQSRAGAEAHSPLRPIPLARVHAAGDVLERARRNFERLEESEFRSPQVFREADYPWPADMEGRTILALTLLAQATHRTPRHLDRILEELPRRCNAKGYLGVISEPGVFNEQQLSGHSWLLRGLCEYYMWRRDADVKRAIERIVEQLLLPARGYYGHYPSRAELRTYDGSAVGRLSGQAINHWYSSTDIGCAFIMLDGASHVYSLFPEASLGEVIEEMVDTFVQLDFRGISCQTHATLSGLRGLLRYMECAGKWDLLDEVLKVWELYLREGMTANFANCNWFGRPLWNEPCAMTDAFMVATTLWRLTGEPSHLETAHGVYYNALGFSQRPNGGFGCDSCPGPSGDMLVPNADLYEAWWCCTMRGGEALSRAIEFGQFTDHEELVLPFHWDTTFTATFSDGDVVVCERTRYPYVGETGLEVLASSASSPKTVRLYVPRDSIGTVRLTIDGVHTKAEISDGFVVAQLPARTGAKLDLHFRLAPRTEAPQNIHTPQGRHVYRHGPLVLGYRVADGPLRLAPDMPLEPLGHGHYYSPVGGVELAPVNDTLHRTRDEVLKDRRQIVFEG